MAAHLLVSIVGDGFQADYKMQFLLNEQCRLGRMSIRQSIVRTVKSIYQKSIITMQRPNDQPTIPTMHHQLHDVTVAAKPFVFSF
jgi:hypothetical protein